MADIDPYGVASVIALLLGAVLFVAGMYARRGGNLHTRQGAAVLAGLVSILGIMVFGYGVYALVASRGA